MSSPRDPSWLWPLARFWFPTRRGPRPRSGRLRLELLESRLAPAAYLVNVAGDSSGQAAGTGSGNSGDLRYCMSQAVADAEADTITFAPGAFAGWTQGSPAAQAGR